MKRIFTIILSAVVACGTLTQAQFINKPASESQAGAFNTTVAPEIPQKIMFCGEEVNLDRYDMYERLDRELIGIINGHTMSMLVIKRANRYFPIMAKVLQEQKVPMDFLYLAVVESTLSDRALSPAKAAGFWQFLASTGKSYGLEVNDEVDERYDAEKSTRAACKYLKEAYKRYGNWPTVAASYNAGMGKISGELGKQKASTSFDLYLVEETSRYVFRIIAYKLFFNNLKKYGYKLTSNQLYYPIPTKNVTVSGPVADWAVWAKQQGTNYARLRDANPWIRAMKLTNSSGKTYTVKVPVSDNLLRSKMVGSVYDTNWVVDK